MSASSGVAAALHVASLPDAASRGFIDDWLTKNILDVFPDLDVDSLRNLAAVLVVYYAKAVRV